MCLTFLLENERKMKVKTFISSIACLFVCLATIGCWKNDSAYATKNDLLVMKNEVLTAAVDGDAETFQKADAVEKRVDALEAKTGSGYDTSFADDPVDGYISQEITIALRDSKLSTIKKVQRIRLERDRHEEITLAICDKIFASDGNVNYGSQSLQFSGDPKDWQAQPKTEPNDPQAKFWSKINKAVENLMNRHLDLDPPTVISPPAPTSVNPPDQHQPKAPVQQSEPENKTADNQQFRWDDDPFRQRPAPSRVFRTNY